MTKQSRRLFLLLLALIVSPALAHAQATVVIERLADLTDVQTPFVDGEFFKWDAGLGQALTAQPQFTDIGGTVADGQLTEEYIKADGTRPLSGNWDAGAFQIKSKSLQSETLTVTGPSDSHIKTLYIDEEFLLPGPNIQANPSNILGLRYGTDQADERTLTFFLTTNQGLFFGGGNVVFGAAFNSGSSDLAFQTTGPSIITLPTSGTMATTDASSLTSGTLNCAREPARTGDVTASAGSCENVLANVPNDVPVAGDLLFTAVAAPLAPAAGKGRVYVDSTSKNLAVKDDAGVVKHGVQTLAAVSNKWIESINDAGLPVATQPACGNLSNASAFCSSADAANLTGTVASGRVSGSYTGITGVGTMTAGTASTGFVVGGVTITLGSDASGDVYYRNSSGVLTRVAAGAQNTVLNMGASSVPAWTAAPTITGTNISGTAASLTAGLATDTVSKTGTGSTYVTNTAPSVVGGSFIELTAFSLRDTAAANDLVIKSTSSTSMSADRILTLDVVNAARTLKMSGNATVDQDVSTTGSPTFAQLTVGAGGIFTGSMNAPSMFSSGSGNSFIWINANSLIFAGTTSGQVTMTVPAVVGGNLTGCTGTPTTATGGISTTCTSDEQYKDIVGPFRRGLADLRDVQPIRFHWNRFEDPRPERAGFGARNVQASIPEAAWLVKQGDGEEVLTLSDRVILATVVNAIKELAARVEGLAK